MSNSVELVSTGQVLVQEVTEQLIELTAPSVPVTVEVVTAGPQGPASLGGSSTLSGLSDVDVSQKVDKSVLYFDASGAKWLGNDVNTLVTITDGGHF